MTSFVIARNWFECWAKRSWCTSPHPFALKCILILSSHIHERPSRDLFPLNFLVKILYPFPLTVNRVYWFIIKNLLVVWKCTAILQLCVTLLLTVWWQLCIGELQQLDELQSLAPASIFIFMSRCVSSQSRPPNGLQTTIRHVRVSVHLVCCQLLKATTLQHFWLQLGRK